MNYWTLIRRSLRHHPGPHLGLFLCTGIAAAVLYGALAVGDSVRVWLHQLTSCRTGKAQVALSARGHSFRDAIASQIMQADATVSAAPILSVKASALPITPGRAALSSGLTLLGVDPVFWSLTVAGTAPADFTPDGIMVNDALARRLEVGIGDEIQLRINDIESLPPETRLAFKPAEQPILQRKVIAIAPSESGGRFRLFETGVPPLLAFLPLPTLQTILHQTHRANLMLIGRQPSMPPLTAAGFLSRWRDYWTLSDLGIECYPLPETGLWLFQTSRIFIDAPISHAALKADPAAEGVLTYFVNRIDAPSHRSTPYSMVSAVSSSLLPESTTDDGIILTQWLADDLDATLGQSLALSYLALTADRRLVEQQAHVTVQGIIPMNHPLVDSSLTPAYPGLAEMDSCSEWQPALPIDLKNIRPQDEDYWKQYRTAPKAFITLRRGQALWSNPFGTLTGIRVPIRNDAALEDMQHTIMRSLDPLTVGFSIQEFDGQAVRVRPSQDFGPLFLGLSLFLIISALILMAFFISLNLNRRSAEIGLFRAIGFSPAAIDSLFFLEEMFVITLGSLFGLLGGRWFTAFLLSRLALLHDMAPDLPPPEFIFSIATLAVSFATMLVIGGFVILLMIHTIKKASIPRLINGLPLSLATSKGKCVVRIKSTGVKNTFAFLALGCALGLILTSSERTLLESFFGAGALSLIGLLILTASLLRFTGKSSLHGELSLPRLAMRQSTRHPRRTMAVMSLIAGGVFLVIAIGANRIDPGQRSHDRRSGTGGYQLYIESEAPLRTVADDAVSGKLSAGPLSPEHGDIVACRLSEGDEAGCRNALKPANPALLGVPAKALAHRQAFTLLRTVPASKTADWTLLSQPLEAGVIPAFADVNTLTWGLGMRLGEEMTIGGEGQKRWRLRFVGMLENSILQGMILIDESAFLKIHPLDRGPRVVMIDVPTEQLFDAEQTIARLYADRGTTVDRAINRLRQFASLETMYLALFQLLGHLGLLLAIIGLGVLLIRNTLERRGELALLRAVGWQRKELMILLFAEYVFVIIGGIGIGTVAGLLAVFPALLSRSHEIPWIPILVLSGTILLAGCAGVWMAAILATRKPSLAVLRRE